MFLDTMGLVMVGKASERYEGGRYSGKEAGGMTTGQLQSSNVAEVSHNQVFPS